MPFAALDLHRSVVEAILTDDHGTTLHRDRFPSTREALLAFARRFLTPQHQLVIEATTNTWAVAALLEPFVARLVVSNPLRTKAIASAKLKTDKVDVRTLAELLRCDYIPQVWQPDAATRHLRAATTERACLTGDRTRIKNRIHAILHQRLIPVPAGDLFSPKNLAWLDQLPLDDFGRSALQRQLRLLANLETELTDVTNSLAAEAYQDARIQLLMTLPGCDFTVAQALLAALGDPTRFPSADEAANYLGLTPSTYQSANHCYHGSITKQGRSHARWMIVEAAQFLDRHPGPLGVFFRRIAKRKCRNVAVVAAARKLVTIAWHMLKNNEPYRYAQPATLQSKFDRLRVRVTQQRKKGGLPKGSKRPDNYGKGRTRAVPSLSAVYSANGLPPLQTPQPGEQAMLDRNALAGLSHTLETPHRTPKAPYKTGKVPLPPAIRG
jgi:transposase